MELKQLESFAAVVGFGSFTKAAAYLYISQPSVSSHIQALEKELGSTLIHRTTKSIELSPVGRKVYEYAKDMLQLRDRMLRECTTQQQSILHLGASTIPASYILPELLPAFSTQAPNTFFVLHQHDSEAAVKGVADGLYDVGLVSIPSEQEELVCQCFYQDRIILITPVTEHFLQLQALPETPLEALLKEPIILREQSESRKKRADFFLESAGVDQAQLNVAARVNNPEVIKNLVAGGLGISFLSERAARNLIAEKRVLPFSLPAYNSVRELYLIYRRDRADRADIREFADFVRRFYSQND